MKLRHLEALPTWCLVNMVILFVPRSHVWFNVWWPLAVWAEGRSEMSRDMDKILWIWFITWEVTWAMTKWWPQ